MDCQRLSTRWRSGVFSTSLIRKASWTQLIQEEIKHRSAGEFPIFGE